MTVHLPYVGALRRTSFLKVVRNLLPNPKIEPSRGPDDIRNASFRRYTELIDDFLVVIFQEPLTPGGTSPEWSMARDVPNFKQGNRLSLTIYNPLSVSSFT